MRLATLAATAMAIAAIVPASASGVELPEATVETTLTGISEAVKLNLTGAAVTCTSGSESFTPTSKREGTFTKEVKGCTLKGEECHSLADPAGVVLVTGTAHLVRIASNKVGTWLLAGTVHIECKFEAILVAVQGNAIASVTPLNTDTKTFEDKLSVVAGKQEITEFENNSGEKVKAKLEGSINGGAFKGATIESANNKGTTALLTEIIKTL